MVIHEEGERAVHEKVAERDEDRAEEQGDRRFPEEADEGRSGVHDDSSTRWGRRIWHAVASGFKRGRTAAGLSFHRRGRDGGKEGVCGMEQGIRAWDIQPSLVSIVRKARAATQEEIEHSAQFVGFRAPLLPVTSPSCPSWAGTSLPCGGPGPGPR